MAARRQVVLAAAVVTAATVFGPAAAVVRGQDAAIKVPEVENSKFQFEGLINANSVLVRSGASDNFYPTARVDKGTPVTVVGIRFDWLKILPPPGSFSFVAKSFVEKQPNGRGRVTRPGLNVRAGSTMTQLKTSIQAQLNEGDQVDIIDEQDEYYRIKPPAGAYVYVNKQFVTPTRVLGENPAGGAGAEPLTGGTSTGSGTTADNVGISGTTPGTGLGGGTGLAGGTATGAGGGRAATRTGGTSLANLPDANAGGGTAAGGNLPPASTQPISMDLNDSEKRFMQLEAEFRTASQKPLNEQPIAELVKGYQSVASDPKLPATYKRIASGRVQALQFREQSIGELAEAEKRAAQNSQRQQALRAERQELEQRLAQQTMHLFAAVGQLQTSSLQQGAFPLFRLTDPGTGRTLVYVRSGDASLAQRIGQLVGVRGEITDDPTVNVKVVTPTGVEPLTAADMPHVAAQIMPPTLLSAAAPAAAQPATSAPAATRPATGDTQ
jgi:uncharacterized protein YgiM (DUF1202 family)